MADDDTEAAKDAAAAARPATDTAEAPAEDNMPTRPVLASPSDAAAARRLLLRVPAAIIGDGISRQFDTIVLLLLRPLS